MFDHSLIQALQALRSPFLDGFVQAISFLGDEPFYLLLLPVLYWAVDRGVALRAVVLLLASAWVNGAAKGLFDLPRPDPAQVAVLDVRSSGGLPSGHAQNAVVAWGYLALRWHRGRTGVSSRAILVGAALLVAAIGVSRLYLGAHFPADVLAGWGLGLGLLLLALPAVERGAGALSRLPLVGRFLAAGLLPLLLLLVYRQHEALPAAATLLGVAVGAVAEREWIRLPGWAPPRARLLRVLVGLGGVLALWAGLRGLLLPGTEAGRILRYVLLGLWVTAGAPWVFRWLEGRTGRGRRF